MLHIILHFVMPVPVALLFYRERWRHAALILAATMLVDVDHLLAQPIYDPQRCSIGFHPLHTWPAIVLYVALAVGPVLMARRIHANGEFSTAARFVHLVGVGLLLHMALDLGDCLS